MAENKKSFVLYVDLIHTISKLPDDQAGKLFKVIMDYVNDKNPTVDDLLLQIAFEPIKQQLKRDLTRWDKFKLKQAENGKKGGRPPGLNASKAKPLNGKDNNPNNPSLLIESQKSLNVNANVNVNVIKAAAGEIDFEKIKEYLRSVTDRRFITDEQIEQEALNFKNKFDGTKIVNLKALCNTWADGMRPWQKKNKQISDFV